MVVFLSGRRFAGEWGSLSRQGLSITRVSRSEGAGGSGVFLVGSPSARVATPPWKIPAYSRGEELDASEARACTEYVESPVPRAVQVRPPSVLWKTPPPRPPGTAGVAAAYTTEGSCGSKSRSSTTDNGATS